RVEYPHSRSPGLSTQRRPLADQELLSRRSGSHRAQGASRGRSDTKGLANVNEHLAEVAAKYSIPQARRHIFICADQSEPKCAPKEETIVAWKYLKRRLEELGISKGEDC